MEEKITAWLAKDKDGTLCLYTTKPWKLGDIWVTDECGINKLFPQVKFEDEEPTTVELTIKIKE